MARPAEPLARHTSLRLGGPADLFVVARTTDQLIEAVAHAIEIGVPWRVIGGASNLLIADEGVEGLVVKAATAGIRRLCPADQGDVLVQAEAGCMLAAAGKRLALQGLSGLQWAVNVPGTVGASVVNNSGAFGSCIAEHLVEASVYVPFEGVRAFDASQLGLEYRTSRLKRGELVGIVLSATYRLCRGDASNLQAHIHEIQRARRANQPAGYSLGSVFANPPGIPAGLLIQQSGLKGHRIGDAEVSRLHANFILNRGAARARDVFDLMRHVQLTVWHQTGTWLFPEVELLGRFEAHDIQALLSAPGAAT